MPTIYRQIAPHLLTKTQLDAKLVKDKEYEDAVKSLSTPYYTKKRTLGVTAEETTKYQTDKSTLWNDYQNWAKTNGLYESVSVAQQLSEIKADLVEALVRLNELRVENDLSVVDVPAWLK